jgi:hypothetical protein
MDDLGVHPMQRLGISDAVLMTSRGGNRYDRTFMESFIRPGTDRGRWSARNNYPAFGFVQTGPDEISIYAVARYAQPAMHLYRYTMRLDGFASVRAGYGGGTLVTKPLRFSGNRLVINYSTSAAGAIRVALTDTGGRVLDGFSAADCDPFIGDEVGRVVTWRKGSALSRLRGTPVRVQFTMKDADLYSLQFAP